MSKRVQLLEPAITFFCLLAYCQRSFVTVFDSHSRVPRTCWVLASAASDAGRRHPWRVAQAGIASTARPARALHVETSSNKSSRVSGRRVIATLGSLSWAAALSVVGVVSSGRVARAAKLATVHSVGGREVQIPGSRPDSRVAHALDKVKYPARWPYGPRDFGRLDTGDDSAFYDSPKLVKHVDDRALSALTAYYAAMFPKDQNFAALDICSSWVSHYPEKPRPSRLAITGMNAEELKRNVLATEWSVKDLNVEPKLPYGDAEFDLVTNTVSVDYLTKPLEVFQEISRVLRPGGVATVAFSNRCFLTKVVALWSSGDDEDRSELVANYFHFAGGFRDAEVVDLSSSSGGDPLYVVSAVKV